MNKKSEIAAGKKYIEVKIKSAGPVWGAVAVWLVAAFTVPMYKISMILLTAVVSLLMYAFLSIIIPKKKIKKAVPFSSGDATLDEIVNRIDDSMEIIDACGKKVYSVKPAIADKISVIINYCLKIRALIIEEPQNVKKITRFLNYYLPTTVKISEKYVHLISQRTAGENVTEAITSTEKAFEQIKNAFIKQHDALFADDALDITTDVSVLETLLKQDSLN